MPREARRPPPGSVVAELRRSVRRIGLRRAALRWGLGQREALELIAGLRVRRSALVAALRHLLAELEAGDA